MSESDLEEARTALIATQSKSTDLESTVQTMETQLAAKQDEFTDIQAKLQTRNEEVKSLQAIVDNTPATIASTVAKAVDEAVAIEKSNFSQLELEKTALEHALAESQKLATEREEALRRVTDELTSVSTSKEGETVMLQKEVDDLKEALASALHSLVSYYYY